MRNEPDKAIEEREKMTEIKEREITEATKNAQQAQKDAAQQKKDGDIQAGRLREIWQAFPYRKTFRRQTGI